MIIYRLARSAFCDATGEGAKRYGGRWNLPGHPALYASATVSSALLERLTVDPELFSAERYVLYSVMEFGCPDKNIRLFTGKDLPEGWDSIPTNHVSQEFGTKLLLSGLLCFGVPSVVDQSSIKYILNPGSNQFNKVKWKTYPLKLDQRIVR